MTLLSYPDATLLDIQPLLTDPEFRGRVLLHVANPHIISFWINEFGKYSPTIRSEAISPILNKTGLFLTSIPLRNIVGQKKTSFKMQQVMDHKKIFIANLAKGSIGEDASSLLGSMLVTAIQLAALHRAKQEASKREPFFLFVDEMHSFLSLSFADILAEARKYGLALFLAHQYIDQLHEKIRAAIFGNVGTIISFRIGATDAEYLEREFHPMFNEFDLVNLPKYSMYLKLMIDGATSMPFSAKSIPIKDTVSSTKAEIIFESRKMFGKSRVEVELAIFRASAMMGEKPNQQQSLIIL